MDALKPLTFRKLRKYLDARKEPIAGVLLRYAGVNLLVGDINALGGECDDCSIDKDEEILSWERVYSDVEK